MKENPLIRIKGHLKIKDDLGNVLVDKDNAIHPQNMSRVIARAFANEDNFWIHRMAFGNGGTVVAVGGAITYKTPNVSGSWADALYNETYYEIVDESNVGVDTGPGSNDLDGGTAQNSVVSTEPGILSEVTITVELNPTEPSGQLPDDQSSPGSSNTEGEFVFDEIGLFTTGVAHAGTHGYQDVDVGGGLTENSDTGLAPSTAYSFTISVDGGAVTPINIVTPASGSGSLGEILYWDLIPLINTALSTAALNATASIGTLTSGNLRFISGTVGPTSTIDLTDVTLFTNLTGFVPPIAAGTPGQTSLQNGAAPLFTDEGERMMTHVIFAPVLKAANRTLTIVYTLSIGVAQAP